MAEDQRINSLNLYNRKNKEVIFPDVNLAGVDHQIDYQQEYDKNEDKEYE